MVGVGLMGMGIASNVRKAGYPLGVLEHPGNQPLDTLLEGGAKIYRSARELAQNADIVILCVTGSPQVEDVLLKEGGVLEGLSEGAVVIDCSTAIPSSTQRIAALVQEKGGRFMDAPMTRTPREAAEGRLNLLVGGDTDLFEEIRPLLATFAEGITHVGPVASGHRMKLLHNYVSLGTIALISEAAACAAQAGMDPSVFVDVLAAGGGGGAALERLTPYLLRHDTSSLRFAMSNAEKDMNYYSAMAEESNTARLIADAVRGTYARAAAADPVRFAIELPSLLNAR
nr:NAD(P)-dependent oxidoreductase [Allopusillimonas soli]